MISLVIFDMDGLMFDTENLSTKMWYKVFQNHSIEPNEEFFLSLRGRNEEACVKLFKDFYSNLDIDFRKLKKEKNDLIYNEIISSGVPVKEGLYELLDYLRERNIKIGLATSSSDAIAKKYLSLANVLNYFDYLVFGNEVKNSKPDPEIFLKVSTKANIKPEDSLVLEDSKAGITAAQNGGFNVYWIPDGVYFETNALRLSNLKEVIKRI